MSDKLPTRGDVGLSEITRDPIFLLQARRWQINHEGIPDPLELADDGDFVDSTGSEPVYYSMADIAEKWPDYVYAEWRTESVWFTREEAEGFGEARSYRFPEGWRVYCLCAEGELAAILKAYTLEPTGTLKQEDSKDE